MRISNVFSINCNPWSFSFVTKWFTCIELGNFISVYLAKYVQKSKIHSINLNVYFTLYGISAILKYVSSFKTNGEAFGHTFARSMLWRTNLASCVVLRVLLELLVAILRKIQLTHIRNTFLTVHLKVGYTWSFKFKYCVSKFI